MTTPAPLELKLANCKEKLINLTRQNNLLFYKKRKLSSLVVKSDDCQAFYNQLIGEKQFSFWKIPDKQDDVQNTHDDIPKLELFKEVTSAKEKTIDDWLSECPPEDDEILCEFSTNEELHKILKNLYRRARTEQEERGLNIAYILFGLLEWSDKKNSERIKSPLILVPIQFEHKSASESYKIIMGDDEAILNPALRVKFKKDFNVILPEIDGSQDDWNLEEYFSLIEQELSSLNVKVSKDVHIGLFSFHKLVMYSDYEKHQPLMEQHPIISCFGGNGNIDEVNAAGGDVTENLDDVRDMKRQFHVLDADSSQQRCIEAACNGSSFVMVGPPGTGKSQTIANIIAEFIEDGKSVLFVSEKMAALEVVFKRLKDCDLADFCLELHSHKANKKQVITELGKSLAERIVPRETIAEAEYKQYLHIRDRLNDYMLALHACRTPLGMSVFEVLGRLSLSEQLPYIPSGLPNVPENITQEALVEYDTLFESLESLWDVFIKGHDFAWHGFKTSSYTPTLRYRMGELLEKILKNSTDTLARADSFRKSLGLPAFSSLTEIRKMSEFIGHLAQDIHVPHSWIDKFDHQKVVDSREKAKEAQRRYETASKHIYSTYSEGFFALQDDYLGKLVNSLRDLQSHLRIQDYQVAELVPELSPIRESLRLLENTLRRILSNQDIVWQDLDITASKSLKNAEVLCEAIALIYDCSNHPELSWFDSVIRIEMDNRIKELKLQVQEIRALSDELMTSYSKDALSLDIERLLELFKSRGFYRTTFLKYLAPQYYRDIKKIRTCSVKNSKISSQALYGDLVNIKKLAELRRNLEKHAESDGRVFGRFYNGEKTSFDDILLALECFDTIITLLKSLGLSDSLTVINKMGMGDFRKRCSTIYNEIKNQDKKIFEFLLRMGIPILDIKSLAIPDLLLTLSCTISSISALQTLLPSLQNCIIPSTQFPSVQDIEEARKSLNNWKGVKEDFANQGQELSILFDRLYTGINTNWIAVEKATQWYQHLLLMLGTLPQESKLKELLVLGGNRKIDEVQVAEFKNIIEELCIDCTALWNEFSELTLNGSEIAWDSASLAEVLDKIQILKVNMDELKLWIDWLGLGASLKRAGLDQFLSDIYKSRDHIFHEQVSSIFRKAVLSEWLNTIYGKEKVLEAFRGEDHTKARDKFIELDIKLNRLSRALVIQGANERKPVMLNGSSGGSQVGILRREMAKQKRHKPIKKLFGEIFDLVIKLKRCFLMSPMSVCQYLEPGKFKFDVVIFDEASQICVEDALPAILRGSHVIIAGDNKQLPPTSFFKAEEQYEFDVEEDAPDIENLESILDECRGLGLKEHMLKWHYRSRHEDLITYSNCKFYGRQLVTFPAPTVESDHLGVKFDFVDNSVYDRGGRRDNLVEARRVAELVFEHFKNYPEKSLGVATLSVSQMEAVWDAIEQKLKDNSEYSKFFTDNRLEGFFVKNLENVQGDERDVIIFCIGYGKDASGRLSMNFGPLNKTGGERRLNVLITRAREKNIVVTSIKAADFDPNITAEGVLHLRNYLAFAEEGISSLNIEINQIEDFDSPLEESIAAAIRQLGYEVTCQVGCAGYRIDLGVVDPINPNKYIIGIECDGATYHSSHTARDRDRLRQAVLENMGWTIYRIWSPDWVCKKSIEIAQLKNAIEAARFDGRSAAQKKEVGNTHESIKHDVVENCQDVDGSESFGREYSSVDIDRHHKPDDFYSSGSGHVLRRQLQKIIQHEAPIHVDILFRRVMAHYRLERMGDRIQGRLNEILRDIIKNDKSMRSRGGFIYMDEPIYARHPNPDDEETIREIEHIAPEEIQEAMGQIVRLHSGLTSECLFGETLKYFGFLRQTESVIVPLKQNLKKLINAGKISLNDTFLVAVEAS